MSLSVTFYLHDLVAEFLLLFPGGEIYGNPLVAKSTLWSKADALTPGYGLDKLE